MDIFKGRKIVIATMHGKEKVIAPLLEKELGVENMRAMEKAVCLRVLDMLWQEHLSYMDHIRDSVRLRAYGGRDPLVEYKNEGHKAFGQLLATIDANIAENILKAGVQVQQKAALQPHAVESGKQKIGRNDQCPCGSGKKYKHCHGK